MCFDSPNNTVFERISLKERHVKHPKKKRTHLNPIQFKNKAGKTEKADIKSDEIHSICF